MRGVPVSILRITLLSVSATYKLPFASMSSPSGQSKVALTAGPPSPDRFPPGTQPTGAFPVRSISRNGCDRPGRVHFAHAIVLRIHKIKISRRIQHRSPRVVQAGAKRRPAVAATRKRSRAQIPRSHDGRDVPCRAIHLANSIVTIIRNDQDPARFHSHRPRLKKLSAASRPAIATRLAWSRTRNSRAHHRGYGLVRCADFTDSIVLRVNEKEIAVAIQCRITRVIQADVRPVAGPPSPTVPFPTTVVTIFVLAVYSRTRLLQ